MTTELLPFTASVPQPPTLAPADGPAFDLMGLVMTGMKPQSIAGYRKDFEAFARFTGQPAVEAALWGLFRLDAGPAAVLVLSYQAAMLDKGLAPATIARRVAALQRAVKRARMAGLTRLHLETEAPRAEAFRDTAGPGATGWRKLLERAEAEAADGTARTARNLAVLLLLHDRALRRGEAVGIDYPGDFDPGRPAVAVLGKGKDDKQWLTINAPSREAIARYVTLRGDWPGPLFVRCDPAAADKRGRLDGATVNRLIKALARRAGLTRAVNAHALRHSGITAALDAGWDLRDVKVFSRHEKIDTVLIYDDRRKDVGGAIARDLGRPRPTRKRARKQTLPGAD